MTLQKLLLQLSKNKNISVECYVSDEVCKITIKEFYTFKPLLTANVDLNQETVSVAEFSSYL